MASKPVFSDPFAAVDLQPVVVAGETVPTRVAVRVQADDGQYAVNGILGRDYQLLTNRKVRDLAEDILSRAQDQYGAFHSIKTLWNGKVYIDYFASEGSLTRNGLDLKLGLLAWNSYDGTRKTGFEVYALNPTCTNQYHSRNRLGFFAWRHTPGEAQQIDTEDALQQISVGAQNIIKVAKEIEVFKAVDLTPKLLKDARKYTEMPSSKWGEVIDHIEEDTKFGLYQALTNVASHELTGMNASTIGSSITEFFVDGPPKEAFHHATVEQVLQNR
jgi:hypothetical protein